MIEISSKKNKFTYNVYHIVKAFFPNEEIAQKVGEKQEPLVTVTLSGGACFSLAPEELYGPGSFRDEFLRSWTGMEADEYSALTQEGREQLEKREVTRRVYRFLCDVSGGELAWGTLTGVRPTKLVMQKLEAGKQYKEIIEFLKKEYFVTDKKADLAYKVAKRESELLSRLKSAGDFSLYAGIPFCPSVCSYCSFSSSPVSLWQDKVEDYLSALLKELKALGEMAKGKIPATVYIGGGTPTTLSAEQLDRLLRTVTDSFDVSRVIEFTVEAGRPDSITEEKLRVLRSYPVTRISVNPQTMQQKTLDLVGRSHTVKDVEDIFYLARNMGFDNINMDLIAGLPGETAKDMRDTLRRIEALRPDSMTVHALAIKRAAKFGQEGRTANLHSEITEMVEAAAKSAGRMGLEPYYLYRQKNIAGNFENVGYAEVDKAGIYNILIMEEKQTILAAGAGASTKVLLEKPIRSENGKQADLVRIENVKNIREYIDRIDEMTERKGEWLWR